MFVFSIAVHSLWTFEVAVLRCGENYLISRLFSEYAYIDYRISHSFSCIPSSWYVEDHRRFLFCFFPQLYGLLSPSHDLYCTLELLSVLLKRYR